MFEQFVNFLLTDPNKSLRNENETMSNIHARGVKFQDVKHKIGIVIEVLNKKKGDDNILKTRKKYEMKHVKDQDLDEIQ